MALAVSDIVANATTTPVFGTSTTKTYTLPTAGVAEGNIMYLVAGVNTSGDVADVLATPSGWSLIGSTFTVPDTASTPRFYIFARAVPGGGLGSTVDITSSSSTSMSHSGIAFAVQNAALVPDVVGTPSATTSTTITCPSVTASLTGGLTIRVGCNDDDDQSSQPSMTSHTAVNFVQVANTVQNGWNAYVWAATQPSTSVGSATATILSDQNVGQTFVIEEDAGSKTASGSPTISAITAAANAFIWPKVYLNTTETLIGATELAVTDASEDGTSITFDDAAGAPTGSLKLGVENRNIGFVGWIDVTVSAGGGADQTASGAPSIGGVTSSGAAGLERSASGSPSITAVTSTGVSVVIKTADGTPIIPAIISAGSAEIEKTASGSPSIGAVVSAGVAETKKTASGAPSIAAIISAGSAVRILTANGAPSIAAIISSGNIIVPSGLIDEPRGGSSDHKKKKENPMLMQKLLREDDEILTTIISFTEGLGE